MGGHDEICGLPPILSVRFYWPGPAFCRERTNNYVLLGDVKPRLRTEGPISARVITVISEPIARGSTNVGVGIIAKPRGRGVIRAVDLEIEAPDSNGVDENGIRAGEGGSDEPGVFCNGPQRVGAAVMPGHPGCSRSGEGEGRK